MKVLHVYRTYFPDPPGGLQEAIRQICISTQAHGVENTVFTLSPRPQPRVIERPEGKVVRCRSWAAPASCDLGSLDSFLVFRKLAAQADVIHYLFPWPYADLLRFIAPKKPSVMTYVSDIVRQQWLSLAYRPLMWYTLRRMDAIVSNAPAYAITSPVLSDPSIAERVQVIPLGIDESSYDVESDNEILTRLGISQFEPFALFIGVLRYYKGLHVLLDACRSIAGKVIIAGTGPEESALRRQSLRLGLRNVVFAGQVTEGEKMALLKACRCLVLPSHLRSEAYGMVLVEASMAGKPMVTCEIGTGTSFVNLHEETGFVVPPESPSALAEAINMLLSNRELSTRFGDAARKRYQSLFSGSVMGLAYTQLFHKVLG